MPPNAPTSNPDSLDKLSVSTRNRLDTAKAELVAALAAETGDPRTALTQLSAAIDADSKQQVLAGLQKLHDSIKAKPTVVTDQLRAEVEALRNEVESTPQQVVRVGGEAFNAVKGATYDKLPDAGKSAVAVGGALVGVSMLPKILSVLGAVPGQLSKGASKIGEGLKYVGSNIVALGGYLLKKLAMLGVAVAAILGVQKIASGNQAPPSAPPPPTV